MEDQYVLIEVDCPDYQDTDLLSSSKPYTLIVESSSNLNTNAEQGLDTPTPFLQLDGRTFKGEYEELFGSLLCFDSVGEDTCKLPYIGSCEVKLRFREVQLSRKGSA